MSFACQFHDDSGTLLDTVYVGPTSTTQCKGVVPQSILPTAAANDSLQLHQCMVVTASSVGHHFPDVTSPWRNMDFVNASHFTRQAVIDTRGLKPIPGKNGHFIYLYLETKNMPSNYIEGPGREFPYPVKRPDVTPFRLTKANDWRLTFPTYIVRVYKETGRVQRGKGKHARSVDILEPLPSFGYYVGHTGSKIFGWRPQLTGANLDQIAPNFYKIFIPNNAKALVRTTVDTKDAPCLSRKWNECDKDWDLRHLHDDEHRRDK
jgi:hypothetical protein